MDFEEALKKWPDLSPDRFRTFGRSLKGTFGVKVYKVTLHAGFTCPNRDGKVGRGGCTYCINESFSPNARDPELPVGEQMRRGMDFLNSRYGAEKFIAYFQTFTNTYAPIDRLRRLYDEALCFPDVVGLSIGTRPDCVPDDVLDFIQNYAPRVKVWIEYGLQSAHDRTLKLINRGHDYAAFVDAIHRTQGRGIEIVVHVILGLPGENREDMRETAIRVNAMPMNGLKIHHLYVAVNTPMEEMYKRGEVKALTLDEYVSLAADFIERTRPDVTLQRLTGDTHGDCLVAPKWNVSKSRVLYAISAELARRGTFQGALWEGSGAIASGSAAG
ncbi:MAG TPA: TIGR01212 family radical SAM protein [Candidatus Brocadiia bacterium]|nr:TIGR01212 family radical SAM protein [Candidatus Brocadiia bacterium]